MDTGGIKDALRYAMLVVGIRAKNLPDEVEKQVLVDFVRNNYGNHTDLEIKMAFDLALSGQLELDNVTAYENFSCEYVGKILNAFRKWSSQEYYQQHRQLKAQEAANFKKLDMPKEDWTEQYNILVESAKNGLIRKEFIPKEIYHWLKDAGRLEFTVDEMWELMLHSAEIFLGEMKAALVFNPPGGYTPQTIKDSLYILNQIFDYPEKDQQTRCLKLLNRDKHPLINTLSTLAKQEAVRQLAISDAANLSE